MKHTNSDPHSRRLRWYAYPGILILVLAMAMGAFLVFLTAAEYRPGPVEQAVSGGFGQRPVLDKRDLRILTFNTGYASLGWESDFQMDGGKGSGQVDRTIMEQNMDGICDILASSSADICMIQEIDLDSGRTFSVNQPEAYASVLPDHGWSYAPNFRCKFVPYPIPDFFGEIDSGVATYSRYAWEDARRISLPNPFSWPLRTANLKRCILITRFPIAASDKELVVMNFHLEAYDSGEGKQAQTDQLLSLIQQEADLGNYVIAGGDFNQIFPDVRTDLKPTSQWVPGALEPLPGDWQYVYDDRVPTCRLLNQPYDPDSPLTQYYVIDGFIVSPNVEVRAIETLDENFRFSDHNPVCMDITLKES